MRSERFKGFVFDLDGTLVLLPVDWKEVRRRLASLSGFPFEGVSIFPTIEKATEGNPGLRKRLFECIDSLEIPAAGDAGILEGASEVVRRASADSRAALVTMQGRQATLRVLGRFGWEVSFRKVITREDFLDRASQLRAACRALASPPGDVLFTGDKMSDLSAGREVGTCVAVVGSRARRDWGADYFSRAPSGLLRLFPHSRNARSGSRGGKMSRHPKIND